VDGSLIVVRAAHFAATSLVVGTLAYHFLVLRPTARAASVDAGALEQQCVALCWLGFAVAVLSGALWLVLEIGTMSGLSLADAIDEGMVPVILVRTQFGRVAIVRACLAILLAGFLLLAAHRSGARWTSLVLAAGLLGSIAWTGHAAGTPGAKGPIHITADVLHLLAAGAWFGCLLPLALTLASSRDRNEARWLWLAQIATRRFSLIGMISVGTLVASGIVNAWVLVVSLRGMLATDYGRLLLLKLALFGAMLALAVVNRLRLTASLDPEGDVAAHHRAAGQLVRNTLIEVALGTGVFVVVGALGTIHPPAHLLQQGPGSASVSRLDRDAERHTAPQLTREHAVVRLR
jgi:putative copper resistance protein D